MVATDVDAAGLETTSSLAEAGPPVSAHPGDVADPASVEQMVAACVDPFGRLDVVANVAGRHEVRQLR